MPEKDTRPFFHKLTKKQYTKLMSSGITIGYLLKNYRQPKWCNYQDALSMTMGCWSLCWPHQRITRRFCHKCDLYDKRKATT